MNRQLLSTGGENSGRPQTASSMNARCATCITGQVTTMSDEDRAAHDTFAKALIGDTCPCGRHGNPTRPAHRHRQLAPQPLQRRRRQPLRPRPTSRTAARPAPTSPNSTPPSPPRTLSPSNRNNSSSSPYTNSAHPNRAIKEPRHADTRKTTPPAAHGSRHTAQPAAP